MADFLLNLVGRRLSELFRFFVLKHQESLNV
jgi:hypothetical protein